MRRRASKSSLSLAARSCVVGLAVVISGCASNKQPNYAGAPYPGDDHRVAAAPMPQRTADLPRKVEIEDDGKPAQAPPARAMRPEEDDPSQPWSPNYGRGGVAPLPAQPSRPKPQQFQAMLSTEPASAVPNVAPRLVASRRLTDAEADQLIARAVSAHEMQRQ
jgi:hypothetical protein